ncbi:Multiple C2 and transmembrane domain-containing protein 1 [Triplophysa tibetana]|uniref:Multiple C2 and transmembrane domain-containing protein 1 n=1 Tax=Triplophysa tibetana TaxID=1572043 RepID=A0A5A9N770_9TELE|nr:Multiple C2 and transmembrane domain-containing protein 1 [Triplophysa tibetana]
MPPLGDQGSAGRGGPLGLCQTAGCHVFLTQIRNGEQKAYVLKNKELTGPTKGLIFLEADVIFNSVKAGLRTFVPPEEKFFEEESKLSKQSLQQNFNRVKRCVLFLMNVGSYINSCFQWESPRRSSCAFLIFVTVVWNFEMYMLPLSLLLLLTWKSIVLVSGNEPRERSVQAMEDFLEDVDEDDDKDEKCSVGPSGAVCGREMLCSILMKLRCDPSPDAFVLSYTN